MNDDLVMSTAALRQGTIGLDRVGWTRSAPPGGQQEFSTLAEGLRTEVIIVGGGLLGCSLALHLAERGLSPVLLEARDIGFGASGRNAGHVATHIEGLKLPAGIRHLPGNGEPYLELVRSGPAAVAAVIEKYGIACNYTPTGHLMMAARPEHLSKLETQQKYWSSMGIAMELLDHEATRAATGSARYPGALHQRSGGRINSFAYTQGLAAAAAKQGARIFTQSPVTVIESAGDAWQVRTPLGEVKAAKVMVCTNAYATREIPYVSRAFYPGVPGVLNFKPLAEERHRNLVPGGATLSQWGLPGAFQKDITGRFYFASIPTFGQAADHGLFETTLRAWLHESFPDLRGVPLEVEAYWTGRTANTLDQLPRIYQPRPGFFAPICCNGLGITTCTQFGRVLAEALLEDRFDGLPVRLTRPHNVPLRSLYNPLMSLVVSGMRLRGRLIGSGH